MKKEVRIEYIVQYLAENGEWYTSSAFNCYKPALAHYQELLEESSLSHRLVMHVDTVAVIEDCVWEASDD